MIAGDNGKVGSAHDIVADLNFRPGCEQRCSRAKVHVMAHVDIARSGDLAVTAERVTFSPHAAKERRNEGIRRSLL